MPMGFADGNTMDDHFRFQKLSRQGWRHHVRTTAERDADVLGACGAALTTTGSRIRAKQLRRGVVWEAWGHHVGEGDVSLVGLSRSKLMQLAKLTLQVADTRAVSEGLLDYPSGC